MKPIILISLVATCLSYTVAMAPEGQKMTATTSNDINMLVTTYAFIYNVDEVQMHKMIHCESTHNPKAVNINKWEESYGLVQINLKAHTNVSKEQALDPDFSVRFLARNLSEGKGRMWSCYKEVSWMNTRQSARGGSTVF